MRGRNATPLCPTTPPVTAERVSDGWLSRRDKRWNFVACLIDAVGWPLGAALISFQTIFPVFLRHLGAGNLAVGALPALYNLLLFLPGLCRRRVTSAGGGGRGGICSGSPSPSAWPWSRWPG